MAIVALHSAASGLSALSTNIDIIANNLANVNNNGFKGERANFEDLLYQEKLQPGVENANGDQRPTGLYVGLGTRITSTQTNFTTGSPVETGGDYDMMINGAGFFPVAILEQFGSGVAYTRAGNFAVNRDGEIVLGNADGPRLEPPITVDPNATNISISTDGRVSGLVPGNTEPTEFGQVQLANFTNAGGLKPIGKNLYIETAASGPPVETTPGDGSLGTILHRFQESSNVDPVRELIELIKTQRAFEMNSQTIQAADQSLQVIGNLRRF
ncbi:MAG: flagellar basal-body rod protein FlgG [Phycisphaera sp.]|nr:flagellar basal-body rod protein FlgG [Phycisphaera sp.]